MLLAVEGGGFFSSSASGYTHGLALLLLGRKTEDKSIRLSPWNQYRLVEVDGARGCQLASTQNQPSGKCASFICFGCTSGGLDAASSHKNLGSANGSKSSLEFANGSVNRSERKGCLKSKLSRDSSERCSAFVEGEDARESLEEVQKLTTSFERRKVQWTDTCGKELAEVREFEVSEGSLSDEEVENDGFRRCECVIQ